MTRPAVRMCARCHRTTSHPVLVHEVQAATGPGFNVYACSECADLYPPMTDLLEFPEPAPRRRSRLTLRVYTVDADGAVTDDRGKIEVRTGAGPTRSRTHRRIHRADARAAGRGSGAQSRKLEPGNCQPTRLPTLQAPNAHPAFGAAVGPDTIRPQAPSACPDSSLSAQPCKEVRCSETDRPTDTVIAHCTFVSRGDHCEAPLFARCCRARPRPQPCC